MHEGEAVALCILIVVALCAMVYFTGCGGPPRGAQTALDVTGTAIVEINNATAGPYASAAAQANLETRAAFPLDRSARLRAYADRMALWNAVVDKAALARHSWMTASRALQAWREAVGDGERVWQATAACLFGALAELASTLHALGLDLPPSLSQALSMVGGFAGNLCDGLNGSSRATSARGESGFDGNQD